MNYLANIANGLLTISIIFTGASCLQAQNTTRFPEIPRIDVHTHVANDLLAISHYHKVREILKQNHGIEMAMWINLGDRYKPINSYDEVINAGMGRILCCISDYSAHDGLKYAPNELPKCLERGYIGYKIWAGPPHRRLKPGQEQTAEAESLLYDMQELLDASTLDVELLQEWLSTQKTSSTLSLKNLRKLASCN